MHSMRCVYVFFHTKMILLHINYYHITSLIKRVEQYRLTSYSQAK
jgi:hypothetical protein